MPGLPATGELSYNGYTFDGATHIEVEVAFVLDDAGRTVIAHRHILTVQAIVNDDNDLDAELFDIRKKLGESGGDLKFISKGFGDDLNIKATGAKRDVLSGPNPKILSWEPLGDNKACGITWQVEVTVAVCKKGTPRSLGVMALNYSADYQIDKHGDTTRTLSGYIQIAQQIANKRPANTADRHRAAFSPAGLAGFTREQSWSLSLDKSRVDFSIVDTQNPTSNPYPPGIIDIDARHSVSWRRGRGGKKFFNTISARITPESRLSGAQAWQVFLTLVAQRMTIAKKRGASLFLEALEAEEGIFSRTHSFSVTYRILSSIKDFIGDSGLWRAIGTNSELWVASLQNSMFNNRGNARLRNVPGDDIVISLCESAGLGVFPNNQQEFLNVLTRAPGKSVPSPGLRNERPTKKDSYIEYESYIVPSRKYPAVRQSIIQGLENVDPSWLLKPALDPIPADAFEFEKTSKVTPDVIQVGGAGRYSVRLLGRAVRAGYPIPRPSILKVGDRDVIEVRSEFPSRVMGNWFGIPVYEGFWDIEYMVTQSPGRVLSLSNAAEQADAQTNTAEQPTGPKSPGTFA